MKPSFAFENLEVWQIAMDLGESITKTSDNFPKKEVFNLSSQICRAADAVALNISESSVGQSEKDFKKFIDRAIRSLAEVVTCLHKAKRRKYISKRQFESYHSEALYLMDKMVAFKTNRK